MFERAFTCGGTGAEKGVATKRQPTAPPLPLGPPCTYDDGDKDLSVVRQGMSGGQRGISNL